MKKLLSERVLPWLVALAAAAVSFMFVFKRNYIVTAVVFIAGYIATRVIVFPEKKALPQSSLPDGVNKAELETALRDARSKLQLIQNESFKITKADARKKLDGIAQAISDILDDIKADPKDLRLARQFLNYYLDATVKIVKHYVDLSSRPSKDAEMVATLERVEGELDTIKAAFEKQLKLLTENDVMDLDVELKVLKKTLEMEGLGGDTGSKAE